MIDITQKQVQEQQKNFSVDLIAFYKVLQDEMIKTINKAERGKWTIEKLIKELESLI